MSGAENARHSSMHSIGPYDVSARPSRSTSRATTLKASSGCGQPPVSLILVATYAEDFASDVANRPAIEDTLQTRNPSPRSSACMSEGSGEGTGVADEPSLGTDRHENPST